MKLYLAALLLFATSALATPVTDINGLTLNVIRYDTPVESVVYTDIPDWAKLPGMQQYWEYKVAKAFADNGFYYKILQRFVIQQINLDPPQTLSWYIFIPTGEVAPGLPPPEYSAPEPGTMALVAPLVFAAALRYRSHRKRAVSGDEDRRTSSSI